MPNSSSPQQKLKVCFIGLYAYPLFNPECISPFGGSEVRVAMIAKELARRGNIDVNIIVFDHEQPHTEVIDQVRVISWAGKYCLAPVYPDETYQKINASKAHDGSIVDKLKPHLPDAVWRFLQFIRWVKKQFYIFGEIETHNIWRSDIKIFDEVDSDVYIIAGNGELTADIVYYCKIRRKKFILLSGSDIDFSPEIIQNPEFSTQYGVSGFLMSYTIKNTDTFLVQTEHQREILNRYYHRESIVIRNPIDLTHNFQKQTGTDTILWVGKSDTVKRPELVLELAEIFPQYTFKIVMTLSNEEIFKKCMERVKNLPNINPVLFVPYNQIEKEYAQAKIFLNTSIFEGFPNTFLQAAKYGVPILSLNVDPDGMLAEHDCGRYCKGDFEAMKSALSELMTKSVHDRIVANGLEYVRKYHDKATIGRQFEETLLSLFKI